jgi:kynureninase
MSPEPSPEKPAALPLQSRADAEALDRLDPLSAARDRYFLPPGIVYLCGNSLGAMPLGAARRAREVVEREWGADLIRSWNVHDWFGLPERVGARIARLIGARPNEVVVADSTSINLYKVVNAALGLQPERRVIVAEAGNFPTNAYVLHGLAARRGEPPIVRAVDRAGVPGAIGTDTAVVVLTHVHYRDCAAFDLAAVTARAHEAGAVVVWDLSHSVGVLPLALAEAHADFAVGCTYKYLGGGPGSPAFIYAAGRHHARLEPGLLGWWGHAAPFALREDWEPAAGIRRLLTGTPSIIALSVLDAALDEFESVALEALHAKSKGLVTTFVELARRRCARHGVGVATPDDPAGRGSHVALSHPHG